MSSCGSAVFSAGRHAGLAGTLSEDLLSFRLQSAAIVAGAASSVADVQAEFARPLAEAARGRWASSAR